VKLEETNLANSRTIEDLRKMCESLKTENVNQSSESSQKMKELKETFSKKTVELDQENQRLLQRKKNS